MVQWKEDSLTHFIWFSQVFLLLQAALCCFRRVLYSHDRINLVVCSSFRFRKFPPEEDSKTKHDDDEDDERVFFQRALQNAPHFSISSRVIQTWRGREGRSGETGFIFAWYNVCNLLRVVARFMWMTLRLSLTTSASVVGAIERAELGKEVRLLGLNHRVWRYLVTKRYRLMCTVCWEKGVPETMTSTMRAL